jgi:hypothetical protein
MVDKGKLLDLIREKFRWMAKEQAVKITVGDDGKVNVVESYQGAGELRCDEPLPNGRLPFEFGIFQASLVLYDCGLTSLIGCPEHITGRFVCRKNKLTNLVGGPKRVDGRYWISQAVPLQNLDGFPNHVGDYAKLNYSPTLPLLRLLNCADGVILSGDDTDKINKIENILEKYKGQGRRSMFAAKKELIEAGFEGNARW